MFHRRFSSENVELLERVGCTVLISDGDVPDSLKQLPKAAEFGQLTVRILNRLPRVWMVGKGTVEIESGVTRRSASRSLTPSLARG